jgi:hypothetical protein
MRRLATRQLLVRSRSGCGAQSTSRLGARAAVSNSAARAVCPPLRALGTSAAAPAASQTSSGNAAPPPVAHPAFSVLKHEFVTEHSAWATLYRHGATGAEVLSVACAEEEKVFGIAFRTPHDGDVGVAHILEHSVLCGSERYPVKEPFVHLLKSSLQVRREWWSNRWGADGGGPARPSDDARA